MTAFAISAAGTTRIGSLAGKTGGDTYSVSNAAALLLLDQHTRHGLNGNTSAIMANITLSATLGGSVCGEGRYTRLIYFTGGSGTIPADGTTITKGGSSGELVGVYTALNVAPSAAGGAMPASGYILLSNWNSVAFTTGALTGITATVAVDPIFGLEDRAGWVEIVGQDASQITINRLNQTLNGNFLARGDWYYVGITDGNRATTYQIPSNGVNQYHPGVWVENPTSSAISDITYDEAERRVTVESTAHGFVTGDKVTISGVTPSTFNGTKFIRKIDNDHYTFLEVDNPGTYVSGGTGDGNWEFYAVTSTNALAAEIDTSGVNKWCWISSAGLVRFGHDGTNSTGGYCPPSGRRIRMGNVFLTNATSAAKTQNALNATPSSRYRPIPTQAGRVLFEKVSCAWGLTTMQTPRRVEITDSGVVDQISVTTAALPFILTRVGTGSPVVQAQTPLIVSSHTEGVTVTDCTIAASAPTGTKSAISLSNVVGNIVFVGNRIAHSGPKSSATNFAFTLNLSDGIEINNSLLQVGAYNSSQSGNVTIKNTVHLGSTSGRTELTNASSYVLLTNKSQNWLIDGTDFGGVVGGNPRNYLLSVGSNSSDVTLRNLGSHDNPIDCGETGDTGTTVSRSGTTITFTKVGHGYRVGEQVLVWQSESTAAMTLGLKTIATVPTADTFTVTGINAGLTSFKASYIVSHIIHPIIVNANVSNIKLQNVHIRKNSGVGYNTINTSTDITLENVSFEQTGQNLVPQRTSNNMIVRSCYDNSYGLPPSYSSVYGTHFTDGFLRPIGSGATGVSWTRSGSTISVNHPNHGFKTTEYPSFANSTSEAALPNGRQAGYITVVDKDNYTFTGINAGAASGTVDVLAEDARILISMNEASVVSASYVTTIGDAAFTGAGGLVMPTVNDSVTWEQQYVFFGEDSFPIIPIAFSGGSTNTFKPNYLVQYQIDRGAGFSGTWKNLSRKVTGGSGTSGTKIITGLSTTADLSPGDYVFGTGIAHGSKIDTVDSSSQITLTINHSGTVSGDLYFNALPNEATLPADGYRLKIKMTTITTNTDAHTSIVIPATSTNTSRNRLYPQDVDTYGLTIEANPGDTVKLFLTADDSILQEEVIVSDPFQYDYIHSGVDIDCYYLVVSDDYRVIKENITLGAFDQSLVLSFVDDLVYDPTYDDRYDVQFNNKLIVMNASETTYSVRGAYSKWKDELRNSDNGKYDLAYAADGGKEYVPPKSIPYLTGLLNGWKIRPQEADHTVTVEDGILYVDGGGDPFVDTLGAYTVRIPFAAPVDVLTVTSGSGVLPGDIDDIAAAVWDKLQADHTTVGSFGRAISDIQDNTDATQAKVDLL